MPPTPASWKARVIFVLFDIILILFWCHFGVLGGPLATLGLPGAPLRRQGGKSSRESGLWVLRGDPFWSPNRLKIEKKSLREPHSKTLCAKCCRGGFRGPPQTMRTMVSFTRNHYFQISTCTSKITGNCFQWVSLWVFGDGFEDPWLNFR
mgnify:CR=1 FL=1